MRESPYGMDAKDAANASLDSLSRTLEALETRLSKLSAPQRSDPRARRPALPTHAEARGPAERREPVRTPAGHSGLSAQAALPAERRRPSFSDAVSEIVMRRQMLEGARSPVADPGQPASAPQTAQRPRASVQQGPAPVAPAGHFRRAFVEAPLTDPQDDALDQRFRSLAGDVEALKQEGTSYSLMAEVAAELQRLRDDIRTNSQRLDPRFNQLRQAFEELRAMIEQRGDASAISSEIARIGGQLERLTEEGADRSTLNTLRAELEEMRNLFGELARETTVKAVGQRWDAFESRYKVQSERDGQIQRELKAELERVRHDLGNLASEDQLRAVERRWDAFEKRYLDAEPNLSESSVTRLLRDELEAMREKLQSLAVEPARAVEQRWGAIEKHLGSRETDIGIQRLAERMADIESTLARLPETLVAPPVEELQQLRQQMRSLPSEDQMRAVERRWDAFEQRYLDTTTLDEAAVTRLVRAELDAMRQKLEGIAEAPSRLAEQRWNDLDRRLDTRQTDGAIQRLAERMGEIEAALGRLPETLSIAPLEDRVRQLAMGVDALARQAQEPEIEQFLALEERLDEISRAIVASSRQAPAMDMAPIERIEARIASLASRVDRITAAGEAVEGDAAALSNRIAELSEQMRAVLDTRVTDQLAERVAQLAGRLDTALTEMERPRIDPAAIEARLSALTLRLEDIVQPQVDTEMMRSLEAQIERLSDQISSASRFTEELDEEFDRRLVVVEQRLDDNREALMLAARTAAEEAVKRMQFGGNERDSEHVARLADSLRSLEDLARDTDNRSVMVFDAVHQTLLKIVDRLEQIEEDIARQHGDEPETLVSSAPLFAPQQDVATRISARAPSAPAPERAEAPAFTAPAQPVPAPSRAAAQRAAETADVLTASDPLASGKAEAAMRSAPSPTAGRERAEAQALDSDLIDRREANRPLEPGSGAPDVAALLDRVRSQQRSTASGNDPAGKADFIAAARRAAAAATAAVEADAEALRTPIDGEDAASPEGRRGIAATISRRRKPILMAVGAVLLALMALPLGAKLLASRNAGSDAPTIEAPAQESTETRTIPPAAPSPVIGEETPAAAPMLAPAPTAQDPAAPPQVDSSDAAVGDMPQEPVLGTSPEDKAPAAASLPPPNMMAGAATAAPQSFLAKPANAASTAGALSPAPVRPLATANAGAVGRIPPSAVGPIPNVPDGIGTGPLASAAAGGDAKAMFEVGLRLLEGRGMEPKPAEALGWLARSAQLGFAPAQYSLGTLFEKGNGIDRDTIAARDWYLASAQQGNVRAMHNLAVLYATGVDGKSDPDAAAKWFEKAATLGMRDSQYNLGILYARGSGVERDLARAYKWFAIVGQSGDKDADAKRQEVGKSLTPDALKAADAAATAFVPAPRLESANTVDIPKEWSQSAEHTGSVDMTRAIRNIQAILGKLGYEAGAPDGVIGDKTKTAIMAFQKTAGLKATGVVDEPLIRALLQRRGA